MSMPLSNTAQESPPPLLLVEDDEALRSILRDSLEMQGLRVIEADCRKTAMTRLASNPDVGVMLIDLGLPPAEHTTAEGIALINAILADNGTAKVIVLTGQDEESSALAAIREGAFDFLAKPAQFDDILRAVKRALLFQRQELQMSAEGLTRLQINARVSDGLKAVREDAEERLVRQVLKETGFNVYQSAARLGLKRESIYYFLKKFGINRQDS
ncbi:MAG: response regulator [Pseudohongiella sp.]|nr:response regulator [Pseudohongiella sp.]